MIKIKLTTCVSIFNTSKPSLQQAGFNAQLIHVETLKILLCLLRLSIFDPFFVVLQILVAAIHRKIVEVLINAVQLLFSISILTYQRTSRIAPQRVWTAWVLFQSRESDAVGVYFGDGERPVLERRRPFIRLSGFPINFCASPAHNSAVVPDLETLF